METVIIAGYGEIGQAIGMLEKEFYGYDPQCGEFYMGKTKELMPFPPEKKVDVLHICFPYGKDFVKSVVGYIVGQWISIGHLPFEKVL